MIRIAIGLLLFVSIAMGLLAFAQGKLAQQATMREAFIAEQEFYLASVWAEKECYKEQLGVFVTPKGYLK